MTNALKLICSRSIYPFLRLYRTQNVCGVLIRQTPRTDVACAAKGRRTIIGGRSSIARWTRRTKRTFTRIYSCEGGLMAYFGLEWTGAWSLFVSWGNYFNWSYFTCRNMTECRDVSILTGVRWDVLKWKKLRLHAVALPGSAFVQLWTTAKESFIEPYGIPWSSFYLRCSMRIHTF